MKSLALSASPRTQTRRKGARKIRSGGRIPAIIYGRHNPPQNLEIDAKQFDALVHTAHSEIILVDLTVADDPAPNRLAIVQDVQHHPLSGEVLHVDFHEVKSDELVTIKVPVESTGEPVGVKTGGGVLEYILRELHVECLPKDLPDLVEVNVEKLEIGQGIHVNEITPPAGVTFLDDKGQPVFLVVAPIAEEAEATAAAGQAEPEVIGAKKEEGEAGAAPAAGKADAKAGEKAADKGAEKAPEKKK